MQIKRTHKNIIKFYSYARIQENLQRYKEGYQNLIHLYETLKTKGIDHKTCQELSGISRATYYRYKKILKNLDQGLFPPSKRPKQVNKPKWRQADIDLVLKIRRENPTYGKDKIAVILKRDHGLSLSVSTVGRIIQSLKNKGLITKSASALRSKRKRRFQTGHAKPWAFKKYEDMTIGEQVQIDHMTVRKNGITLKHFQAWDRKTKFIHAAVYSNAKASSAKRFLLELIQKCPFPILSIQVDGGSEFMADFENTCHEQNIPLFVLPPRKPQYNGGVERGNRTFREEFYQHPLLLEDSVRGVQAKLTHAVHRYNSYRPHFGLKGLTPMQYIQNTLHTEV